MPKYTEEEVDKMHVRVDSACDSMLLLDKQVLDDFAYTMVSSCRRPMMHALVDIHCKGASMKNVDDALASALSSLVLLTIGGFISHDAPESAIKAAHRILAKTTMMTLATIITQFSEESDDADTVH